MEVTYWELTQMINNTAIETKIYWENIVDDDGLKESYLILAKRILDIITKKEISKQWVKVIKSSELYNFKLTKEKVAEILLTFEEKLKQSDILWIIFTFLNETETNILNILLNYYELNWNNNLQKFVMKNDFINKLENKWLVDRVLNYILTQNLDLYKAIILTLNDCNIQIEWNEITKECVPQEVLDFTKKFKEKLVWILNKKSFYIWSWISYTLN